KSLLRIRAMLEAIRNRYWSYHGRIESRFPFNRSLNLRRALFLTCKIGALGYWLPLELTKWLNKSVVNARYLEALEPDSGDILLLLDSSWHGDFFDFVRELKGRDVGVVSVIYDLIPITHPQFCDEHLVKVFNGWLDWMVECADGYIAISRTIAEEFRVVLLDRLGDPGEKTRWVDSFYLGADFEQKAAVIVRDSVKAVFTSNSNVYLTVSTIEPRKNHAYMIDAFELLWQEGHQVSLCVVGKVGWKTEALVDRIHNHPEFGRRLIMLNDLSDAELEYCYEYARALIFASYVEGFGLPLVEAAQRGLPVLCSDIPVFREIGGEACHYFDLSQPSTLKHVLLDFQALAGQELQRRAPVEWISWQQSAQQLVDVVAAHA
ncbi:glycosyltransferase family 4 protein, partial [bacterium]|nr:glycosyltransferase family 4 protein [bacterium]